MPLHKTKIKMDKNQDAPLYLKIFQMTKYLHLIVKNFPKEYKYDLGKEMQNLAWKCLDEFLEANSLPNSEKYSKVKILSDLFDQLKVRVRMGRDLGLITEKQFIHLQSSHIQGIGEMIGGWMEWSKQGAYKS